MSMRACTRVEKDNHHRPNGCADFYSSTTVAVKNIFECLQITSLMPILAQHSVVTWLRTLKCQH